jgi:transmembrane sensor
MNQYDFDKLMQRYLDDQTDDDQNMVLDEWAKKQMESVESNLTPQQAYLQKTKLWTRVQDTLKLKKGKRQGTNTLLFVIVGLIVLVFGVYFLTNSDVKVESSNYAYSDDKEGMEFNNTAAIPHNFKLLDGTNVRLSPNSKLKYAVNFGKVNRIVLLEGEGIFDVIRDVKRPFIVYAGGLATEVLGTSFKIKSFNNESKAEVSVISGIVKVYNEDMQSKKNNTILKANHKAVFDKKTSIIKTTLVEKPIIQVKEEVKDQFIFEEEPLSKVFKIFKEYYNLDVVVTNQSLLDCLFTGDLTELAPTTQLDIICKSVTAKYKANGREIIIDGVGCE